MQLISSTCLASLNWLSPGINYLVTKIKTDGVDVMMAGFGGGTDIERNLS